MIHFNSSGMRFQGASHLLSERCICPWHLIGLLPQHIARRIAGRMFQAVLFLHHRVGFVAALLDAHDILYVESHYEFWRNYLFSRAIVNGMT